VAYKVNADLAHNLDRVGVDPARPGAGALDLEVEALAPGEVPRPALGHL